MLDLPLESIHPLAFGAAQAVRCAQDQDKFWEMHDRLFANTRSLQDLRPHAEAVGLDLDAFDACMESDESVAEVRKDIATARSAGATGTPAFIFGLTDPDDPNKVEGVTFVKGARHYSGMRLEVEKILKSTE